MGLGSSSCWGRLGLSVSTWVSLAVWGAWDRNLWVCLLDSESICKYPVWYVHKIAQQVGDDDEEVGSSYHPNGWVEKGG